MKNKYLRSFLWRFKNIWGIHLFDLLLKIIWEDWHHSHVQRSRLFRKTWSAATNRYVWTLPKAGLHFFTVGQSAGHYKKNPGTGIKLDKQGGERAPIRPFTHVLLAFPRLPRGQPTVLIFVGCPVLKFARGTVSWNPLHASLRQSECLTTATHVTTQSHLSGDFESCLSELGGCGFRW